MRMYLFLTAAALLCTSTALAQSPLEELERRLETGPAAPREPGFLGVTADDRVTDGRGLLVAAVRPGSPAEVAGLRAGDVLVELERRPLRTLDDMGAVLQFRAAGESVNLTFQRNGERHVVTARLAARPAPEDVASPVEPGARPAEEAPPRVESDPGDEFLPPPVESVVPFPKRATAPADPRDELATLRREAVELRRRLEDLERRLAELTAALEEGPDKP